MSKFVFMLLLNDILSKSRIRVKLSEIERNQLYEELINCFGLAGGLNVCEALERAWQDPYNRSRIEEFILAWFRRRMKKRIEGEYRTGIV